MTITILDQKAFETLEVHIMISQAMGLFLQGGLSSKVMLLEMVRVHFLETVSFLVNVGLVGFQNWTLEVELVVVLWLRKMSLI